MKLSHKLSIWSNDMSQHVLRAITSRIENGRHDGYRASSNPPWQCKGLSGE